MARCQISEHSETTALSMRLALFAYRSFPILDLAGTERADFHPQQWLLCHVALYSCKFKSTSLFLLPTSKPKLGQSLNQNLVLSRRTRPSTELRNRISRTPSEFARTKTPALLLSVVGCLCLGSRSSGFASNFCRFDTSYSPGRPKGFNKQIPTDQLRVN